MRRRAGVADVDTTEFVLRPADARVRDSAVCTPELRAWDPGQFRPVRFSCVEIETLVEIHAHAEARFVDLEEPPQPRAVEVHHRSIGVGELHLPVALRAFSCVQSDAGNEEGGLAQLAETFDALAVACGDLRELRLVERVQPALRPGAALGGREGDVADPHRDGRLADAERAGDGLQGHVAGAHRSLLVLLLDLAAVAHVRTLRLRCDSHPAATRRRHRMRLTPKWRSGAQRSYPGAARTRELQSRIHTRPRSSLRPSRRPATVGETSVRVTGRHGSW